MPLILLRFNITCPCRHGNRPWLFQERREDFLLRPESGGRLAGFRRDPLRLEESHHAAGVARKHSGGFADAEGVRVAPPV